VSHQRRTRSTIGIVSVLVSIWLVLGFIANRPEQGSSGGKESGVLHIDSSKPSGTNSVLPVLSEEHPPGPADIPRIENRAFRVGEHLAFEIVYGPINAGTATMSIPDTQWVRGRPCYHVVTTAESNAFFDSFFKVRDRVETFIDVEGIFPWKFEKRIREGKYREDRTVDYDQMNGRVISNNKDTLTVAPFIQGVLSSFYYVRTVPLKVGKSFDIDSYGDGKVYPIKVLVHKKDRVRVPAGTFDCIVVEPVMRVKGIFNRKGRMAIWLTDDEQKIPVLMKSKIIIGSIDARIKSIKTTAE
jgi:hypothetical protein